METEQCDHEFEFIDESFDHEFGTEIQHCMRCIKCGFEKDPDYDNDDIHYDYERYL